ncbi:MAG: hypothetical protein ACO3ZZ_07015 [Solirubrobacterales bacterium]
MNRPLSIAVRGIGRLWPAALIFGLLLGACLGPASPASGTLPPGKGNGGEAVRAYPSSNLRTLQWWLDAVVDPAATTPPEAGSSSPRLAIVAPGIDVDHPDLASLEIAGATSLGPSEDLVGTAAAGIAAGRGGRTGTVGIWPGMKLRLASTGSGTCEEAADAIFRIARKPGRVRVILLAYSFEAPSCPRHLAATQYAVSRKLLVVAPTGNSNPVAFEPRGPAADPHVLGVGAIDEALGLADFSTVGPAVDLVAPGAIDDALLDGGAAAKTAFVGTTHFVLIRPQTGGRTICQANTEMTATTTTPDACDVEALTIERKDDGLVNAWGWVQVKGKQVAKCNITVSYPKAADGAGLERSFELDVVALRTP